MPPPLTPVNDIKDIAEWCLAGRDEPEGWGARRPPAVLTIVIVDVIVNDGGGVGADDQHPPPHAIPDGQPADDVATIIVGFPPVVRSPAGPLPNFRVIVFVVVFIVKVVFPSSPPLGGGGGDKDARSGLAAGSSGSWLVVACI